MCDGSCLKRSADGHGLRLRLRLPYDGCIQKVDDLPGFRFISINVFLKLTVICEFFCYEIISVVLTAASKEIGEDADLVEHKEKQIDGFGRHPALFTPKVNGRELPSVFLFHAAHPMLAGLCACQAVYQFLATFRDGCLPFNGWGGFKHIAYQGHGGTIRGQQTVAEQ